MDPKRLWAPVVAPHREIKNRVDNKNSDQLKAENMLSDSDFVPVSVFLVFDILTAQKAGTSFESLRAATDFVTGGRYQRQKDHRSPSRVLLVSVGRPSDYGREGFHDYPDLFPTSE
jgi:hypothetical protein